MKRLILSAPALHDLLNIIDRIGAANPVAALEQVERVENVISHLPEHPALGKSGRARGTRELAVDGTPYVVQYEVHEETVEVLRVLHGRQIKRPPLS